MDKPRERGDAGGVPAAWHAEPNPPKTSPKKGSNGNGDKNSGGSNRFGVGKAFTAVSKLRKGTSKFARRGLHATSKMVSIASTRAHGGGVAGSSDEEDAEDEWERDALVMELFKSMALQGGDGTSNALVCLVAKGQLVTDWRDPASGDRLVGVKWFRVVPPGLRGDAANSSTTSSDQRREESFEPLTSGDCSSATCQPCLDDVGCRLSAQCFDVRNPAVCRFAELASPVAPSTRLVAAAELATQTLNGDALSNLNEGFNDIACQVAELRVACVWATAGTEATTASSPSANVDPLDAASDVIVVPPGEPSAPSTSSPLASAAAVAAVAPDSGSSSEPSGGSAIRAPTLVEEVGPRHAVEMTLTPSHLRLGARESDTPRGIQVALASTLRVSGSSQAQPAPLLPPHSAAPNTGNGSVHVAKSKKEISRGDSLLPGYDDDDDSNDQNNGGEKSSTKSSETTAPSLPPLLDIHLPANAPCRIDVCFRGPVGLSSVADGLKWFGDEGGELWAYVRLSTDAEFALGQSANAATLNSGSVPHQAAQNAAAAPVAAAAGAGSDLWSMMGDSGKNEPSKLPAHNSSGKQGGGASTPIEPERRLECLTLQLTLASPEQRDLFATVARLFASRARSEAARSSNNFNSAGSRVETEALAGGWVVPWKASMHGHNNSGGGGGGSGSGNDSCSDVIVPTPQEVADALKIELAESQAEVQRLRSAHASAITSVETANASTMSAEQAAGKLRQQLQKLEQKREAEATAAALRDEQAAKQAVALEASAQEAKKACVAAEARAAGAEGKHRSRAEAAERAAQTAEQERANAVATADKIQADLSHWRRKAESLAKECSANLRFQSLAQKAQADLQDQIARNDALEEQNEIVKQEAAAYKQALEHALSVTELPPPPSSSSSAAERATHFASSAYSVATSIAPSNIAKLAERTLFTETLSLGRGSSESRTQAQSSRQRGNSSPPRPALAEALSDQPSPPNKRNASKKEKSKESSSTSSDPSADAGVSRS